MISAYCDTDDWSPSIIQLVKESPHLNTLDLHISINCISQDKNKKYNILVLQESPGVLRFRGIIDFVKNHKDCFKIYNKVYTCIDELIGIENTERIHPSNITWIKNPILLPSKNKLISFVTSNYDTLPGHKNRLKILNKVKHFVDVYGKGINEIKNKDQGLVDYYYSIAVENDDTNSYFSEKIVDCFLTSTIPIYWGSDCVFQKFNYNGIIDLKKISNLNDIKDITNNFYKKNIDAVVDNYFIAQKENRYLPHTLKHILTKFYYEQNI
jgi:hypothetical protein